MDIALSLSSSLGISKPLIHSVIPLSSSLLSQTYHQTPSLRISCIGTKVSSKHDNLYKILSLSPKNATMDDIKKAYRSMALRYHPDVCLDPSKKEESTRMFVELNEAYEILSNQRLQREEEYDSELGFRNVESWRQRWQQQLAELKRRRSHHRRHQHEPCAWASRMKTQNIG